MILVSESDGPRIVDRWSCTGPELGTRLAAAGCDHLLVVLPASATLVRTVHVPPASPLQVESAIRIEAEAKLLGSAPAHRTATGILGVESKHPTGLTVAWPDGLDANLPALSDDIEVHWVPEIACLAFLSGVESTRIFAQITQLDDSTAVSAVIPSSRGPVFRSMRSDHVDRDAASILRPLVVETLLADQVSPDHLETESSRLLTGLEERQVAGGLIADGSESDAKLTELASNITLEQTGRWAAVDRLLLAILGVRTSGLSHLAELQRDQRSVDPGLAGRVFEKLSNGRTAVAIVTTAILVFLLVPLASAGLRLAVMHLKIDDLAKLQSDVEQHDNLKTVYRVLGDQAWSMTKLLGDIANLTPEQIELTSISIAHGEPMAISGVAKRDGDYEGRDVIFEFNRRLRESGLFADAGPLASIEEPDSRGYTEFNVSADLANPLRPLRTRAEEDYAVLSYQDRRYGPTDDDGYLIVDPDLRQARLDSMIDRGLNFDRTLAESKSKPDPESVAVAEDAGTEMETSTSESQPRGSLAKQTGARPDDARPERPNDQARDRRARPARPSRPEPGSRSAIRDKVVEIPPPLTQEEIATLSNAEAKAMLEKVAEARKQPGVEDEVKSRLKNEFYQLMARIQETNSP